MSETRSKREARRRKILENADKRLQRITQCKGEEEGGYANLEKKHTEHSRIFTENRKCYEKRTDYLGIGGLIKDENNDGDHLSNSQSSCEPFAILSNNKLNDTIRFQIWKQLGFKLVILAISVRIVHIFKLGYLFGETIVIPFALFMMTQLGSCQFEQNVIGIAGPMLFFIVLPTLKTFSAPIIKQMSVEKTDH